MPAFGVAAWGVRDGAFGAVEVFLGIVELGTDVAVAFALVSTAIFFLIKLFPISGVGVGMGIDPLLPSLKKLFFRSDM
jgi:hypothetical protein